MNPFFPPLFNTIPQEFYENYEDYSRLLQPSKQYSDALHASNLFPAGFKLLNIPKELDLQILALEVSLSSVDFSISGIMMADEDILKSDPPKHFTLETIQINAQYMYSPTASHNIFLEGKVLLKGYDITSDALLTVSVAYDSLTTLWKLQGEVDNLSVATLVSFFPGGDGSTVMDIAKHFVITKLYIGYQYGANGKGNAFNISATLLLDVLQLQLSFQWPGAQGRDWDFVAVLKEAPSVDTTLRNLLSAVLNDSTIAEIIPDFANIHIGSTDMAASQSNLALHITKSHVGDSTFIVFVLALLIAGTGLEPDVHVRFIQLKDTSTDASGNSTSPVKRMITVSVDSIPWDALDNVPMIGAIQKPFKELEYAWVHDDTKTGLTRKDVLALQAIDEVGTVRYQDLTPVADRTKPEHLKDVLLIPGSHFLITADDRSATSGETVILDYTFGSAKDKEDKMTDSTPNQTEKTSSKAVTGIIDDLNAPKPGFKLGGGQQAGTIDDIDAPTPGFKNIVTTQTKVTAVRPKDNEPEGQAKMGKLKTSQGPLSISNVGLKYADGALQILFDATVKLGPLEFGLLGFGISLSVSSGINLRSLTSLRPGKGLNLTLKGLEAEYNDAPLVIAGLFENLSDPPDLIKFVGGISVGFQTYSFLAVGGYEETINPNTHHRYKSVFVFAKLNGPLMEFEFAEISGICGGFGYNSDLRFPTLPELDAFPFVTKPAGLNPTDDLADKDPLVVLSRLLTPTGKVGGWVTAKEGSMWLAAGLDVKAFQVLSVNAIIVLEFNPYVNLGIFAKAIARLPAATGGGPPPPPVIYAELGLVATVDFHGGAMRIEASLSPNSFVLNPFCHLSGGFGLVYFWGANEHGMSRSFVLMITTNQYKLVTLSSLLGDIMLLLLRQHIIHSQID